MEEKIRKVLSELIEKKIIVKNEMFTFDGLVYMIMGGVSEGRRADDVRELITRLSEHFPGDGGEINKFFEELERL